MNTILVLAALVAMATSAPQYGQPLQAVKTIKQVTTVQHSGQGLQGLGQASLRQSAFEQAGFGQVGIGQATFGQAGLGQTSLGQTNLARQSGARQYKAEHLQAQSKEAAADTVEEAFEMPDPEHYSYLFKTNNGIEKKEQAEIVGDSGKVQGAYSWVAPDGQAFKVEYIADEAGFRPIGAHLPQAPELSPEMSAAIARSLEWNAAHPEEDDSAKWESAEGAKWESAAGAQWQSAARGRALTASNQVLSTGPAFTTTRKQVITTSNIATPQGFNVPY